MNNETFREALDRSGFTFWNKEFRTIEEFDKWVFSLDIHTNWINGFKPENLAKFYDYWVDCLLDLVVQCITFFL